MIRIDNNIFGCSNIKYNIFDKHETVLPARYLQLFSTEVVINQTPKIPISIYFLNITLQSISVRMRRKYEKMSLRKIDDWMRLINLKHISVLLVFSSS